MTSDIVFILLMDQDLEELCLVTVMLIMIQLEIGVLRDNNRT